MKAAIAHPEKEIFSFPLVGEGAWAIGERAHVEFLAAFPHLDVLAQYAKARAWLVANAANRKTPRGMPKFLFSWLERAQNSAARAPAAPDARCVFHRLPNTRGKPARFPQAACPECKHATAARRDRQGEPTPAAAIVPATREQLAAMRPAKRISAVIRGADGAETPVDLEAVG